MKAVVVLSGGQDSATCLALAVKKYGAAEVAAITFSYGQRHAIEVRFARRLAKSFRIAAHKVVRLDFYRHLTANALFDPTMKIVAASSSTSTSSSAPTPPNTVVEGRNAIFLQLAAVWAKTLSAREVYTGVSEADYSGYPDCRAAFIMAEERAIRLALDYPIRLVTPFMKMTKAEEWALAAKLNILELIEEGTVTCYNGIPGKGCGKCPACKLRARGYREWKSSLKTTR